MNKIIIINFFFFFNNITTSYRVFFFNWLNNIHILNIFIRIFFWLSFEKRFLKKNNYIYDLEGGGNKNLVFFFFKGILIKKRVFIYKYNFLFFFLLWLHWINGKFILGEFSLTVSWILLRYFSVLNSSSKFGI
jgi:hypothetical protein